jgi:DUF1680 family protein
MSLLEPRVHAATPVSVVDTAHSPRAALRPLGLDQVRVTGGFWAPVLRRNREVTVDAIYRQLIASGTLDNFRRAAGTLDGGFQGKFFADSDVYKWMEAACWTLARDPDPALRARVDEVVAVVAAAQEADGYLDTYYPPARAALRFTDLPTTHEMYCAGHLVQAAVAHQRTTGSGALLEVALGVAAHIERRFGPGRQAGADGHPCLEMALVELARLTGGKPYHQDHARLADQREPVGHAVRGLYLYSAAADLVAESAGVEGEREALEALWERLHDRRVYVTGGVGARWDDEACGDDYELPNRRAHAETCAAVAHVQWAWRMLHLEGDGRYRDALETTLFNAVLVGVSLTGPS